MNDYVRLKRVWRAGRLSPAQAAALAALQQVVLNNAGVLMCRRREHSSVVRVRQLLALLLPALVVILNKFIFTGCV